MSSGDKETSKLGFAESRRVAEFFGISVDRVRKLAATGMWPAYCVGGRRLFDMDEIRRIVRENPLVKEGESND